MCTRKMALSKEVIPEFQTKRCLRLFIVLFIFLISLSPLAAQNTPLGAVASPPQPRRAPGAGIDGFLGNNELSYLSIIPPYPVLQSLWDEVDATVVRQWQRSADSARWQLAKADADVSYDRFSEAFGSKIDAATAPLLVHLLNRVEADFSSMIGSAKKSYNRPRPFQRFQMTRVCGFDPAPLAEASPKRGDSYPSGHATFGWSVALVLAEVAPERAQVILDRGREYGESRIVCAMHYPSDVHAGELLSSAVVSRLQAIQEFKRELGCAQEERAVALKVREQLGSECSSLKRELEQKQAAANF